MIFSNTRKLSLALCVVAAVSQGRVHAQSGENASDADLFDAYLVGNPSVVEPASAHEADCSCSSCCAPQDACAPSVSPEVTPETPLTEPETVFVPSTQPVLLTARSRAPAMIGDFFGPAVSTETESTTDSFGGTVDISGSGVPGFQSGLQKIVENTSPLPQDRIFFNYSFFDNTPLVPSGAPVNRFTPGFEKTFADGRASFEARFPFAATLDSDILVDSSGAQSFAPNTNQIEFDDITLFLKAVLAESETHALTGGLGITLPTANDLSVFDIEEQALLEVENESVHLLPFLGGVYVPNERFFAQAFVQLDVDANGNPVFASGGEAVTDNGSPLGPAPRTRVGSADAQTFLFADVGVGYWIFRERSDHGITGIAPRLEVHYNTSLDDPDVVSFDRGTEGDSTGLGFAGQVATSRGDFELVNALLGMTVEMHNDSTLTVGYVAPIGGGSDQVFDGELRILLNYFFGGPSPVLAGPTSPFAR